MLTSYNEKQFFMELTALKHIIPHYVTNVKRQIKKIKNLSQKVLTKQKYYGILVLSLKVTEVKEVKNMSIGEKLKALRGDKSRDKVAADLGISSSALGMYECNKRVPRDELKKKIADYFGANIQQLFFED